MTITAILRGFKVPVAALDRFLRANGLMETEGYAPFYHNALDDASKLLRAKAGDGDTKTRLFVPYRMGRHRSTYAYVAYAWIFVYAQRKLHLAEELPDTAPEGFAELRDETLGFAEAEEAQALQDEEVNGMFVTISDERAFNFKEPFVRQSDLRCTACGAAFDYYFAKLAHCREAHGAKERDGALPGDI